jgi:hypothetical protein
VVRPCPDGPHGTDHEPTAAEASQAWRDAERKAIRSTAQREATEEATEASRAVTATSEAAAKVLRATGAEGDARPIVEQEALVAEEQAKEAHRDAVDRAAERYGRRSGD